MLGDRAIPGRRDKCTPHGTLSLLLTHHRAQRQLDLPQLLQRLLHLSPAQPVPTRQQGGHRGETGPERPPRFRPVGGAFARAGVWGGSVDGGREELDEFWPSWASSSRIRPCRATISACAADGVAAQTSGGRGWSARSMGRGIPRHRSSRKRQAPGGPECLRAVTQSESELSLTASRTAAIDSR